VPGAAATVAGDDAAPSARTGIADQPAAAAGNRTADRYSNSHNARGADAAAHLATSRGRKPPARNREWGAVARTAIARPGEKDHVPDPIIGMGGTDRPGVGARRNKADEEPSQHDWRQPAGCAQERCEIGE